MGGRPRLAVVAGDGGGLLSRARGVGVRGRGRCGVEGGDGGRPRADGRRNAMHPDPIRCCLGVCEGVVRA